MDSVQGSIPSALYESLRQGDHDFGLDTLARRLSRLGASRIEITNRSDAVIENVRLRMGVIGQLYSIRVASTKHLAKEAVRIDSEEQSVRISVEDLPKGETIVIEAFHEGSYGPTTLKSERANIELLEDSLYRFQYDRERR